MNDLGKTLITIGAVVIAVGALLLLAGRTPWIGRLPGDIFIKRENFSFYFPLTTCFIVSILFSLLLWLFRK
jgi:hypothetical protein